MGDNKIGERVEIGGGRGSGRSGRSHDLEEELTIVQFSKIMDKLDEVGQQDSPYQRSPQVSTEEFRSILAEVFGKSPEDRKVKALCNKIDAEGLGFVRAEEFCSYIIQKLKEKDSLSQNLSLPFNDPPKLRHTVLCKETICSFIPCFNSARYISVSKNGLVATWNSQLHYQQGKNVLEKWPGRRVKVTDSLVMGNCSKLVLSLSSRELTFFDMVDDFKCKFKLHDLPCIPLCLNYYFDPKAPKSKSYLLYGDDSGSVSILTFMKPTYSLFSAPTKDDESKVQLIAHVHLSSHGEVVSLQTTPHLHADWVNGIRYIPHNHTFISSTNSPTNSVVIRDISHNTNNYVFKLRKGVQCFDYCRSADLLVTGSLDHFVRVFNPFVPVKPVATLTGHDTAVVGLTIAAEHNLIFSLGRSLTLYAWDMKEHVPLQTITIKLPFIQRMLDFGAKPLLVLPSGESLMVTSNEYTAELKLGLVMGGEEDGDLFVSHKYPLCSALYNRHFNQVVSGCEGGVVNIWDVGSGSLVVHLTDCHGRNEITAMSLDKMGRLLMTGSRAGDIKVWQYIGSTCIKHMQKNSYTEVTGIIHIPEKRVFMSVGWDRKITAFKDDPDVYSAEPDNSWKRESTYHEDDILSVAYSPPYYLATGSFDGEIKVWNVDMERVLVQYKSICRIKPHILQKLKKSVGISKKSASFMKVSGTPLSTASSSRPVSRRLASRQRRLQSTSSSQIQHVPVDQLIFLHSRMRAKVKGAGILVSSEAGVANFWDLFGKLNPVGSFPLTENESENVLAMATDTTEKHLLAGDTQGFVSVFFIQDYCNSDQRGEKLDPIARWKAHVGEVVSVDYVPHRTQALVVSASGDGTVRLWTLMGHFIGTFGQETSWDLHCSATFQHPKTPWGDMWKPNTSISSSSFKSLSQLPMSSQNCLAKNNLGSQQSIKEVPEQQQVHVNGAASDSSLSSLSSLSNKQQVSEDTNENKNRVSGVKEKKVMLGSVSKAMAEKLEPQAPFHALKLSKMEDVKIPMDISMALKNLSP